MGEQGIPEEATYHSQEDLGVRGFLEMAATVGVLKRPMAHVRMEGDEG